MTRAAPLGLEKGRKHVIENWQRAGFGLYIHWPFCASKCPYCDFNSHVVAKVDQRRWRDALLKDLASWAERTPNRVLGSIFFGGGTPSLMLPETVQALIEAARRHWTPANDLEVTLEANPTSVEAGRFQAYRDAGVNRFSIGLQALNDRDLQALGRLHTVAEGRRAYEIARTICERVSFDLIYARQDQTLSHWHRELENALAFAGEHLSLYQLTVEQGTAFGDRHSAGKLRGLPDDDLSADLFEHTQDLCCDAGFERYEISNHARPGAECRHNLTYWNGGDWIGTGPGAHGRITIGTSRYETAGVRDPASWLRQTETDVPRIESAVEMTELDTAQEYMMMALRTREGLDLKRLRQLNTHIDPAIVGDLVNDGLVRFEDDRLYTSERGALLVNSILSSIVPGHSGGQQAA